MYTRYEPTPHDLARHEQIRKILRVRDREETARKLKMSAVAYQKKLAGKRVWTQVDCDAIVDLTGRVIRLRRAAP